MPMNVSSKETNIMPDIAHTPSYGSALKALRTARENLMFISSVHSEINGKAVNKMIANLAGASRCVFESYLRETSTTARDRVRKDTVDAAA
jgi:ABC-type transport system involved in cytochrome c biogenesis ATPase subunit